MTLLGHMVHFHEIAKLSARVAASLPAARESSSLSTPSSVLRARAGLSDSEWRAVASRRGLALRLLMTKDGESHFVCFLVVHLPSSVSLPPVLRLTNCSVFVLTLKFFYILDTQVIHPLCILQKASLQLLASLFTCLTVCLEELTFFSF